MMMMMMVFLNAQVNELSRELGHVIDTYIIANTVLCILLASYHLISLITPN